jgi:hypothetical protein
MCFQRHRAQAKADARAEGHAAQQSPLTLEDVVQVWDTALRPKRARYCVSDV